MAPIFNFGKGWRNLSLEDRGLLFTLAAGSANRAWKPKELEAILGVDETRCSAFVEAALAARVLELADGNQLRLADSSDDAALRKSWERRFEEVFWPAVTTPWKKLGKANAFKVWRASVYALIKPKTEEAADALLAEIMDGVERYKKLLLQPNAPSMKYPEGWLSGQRWRDEIDDRFIEQHGIQQAPGALSPLERARMQQEVRARVIDQPVTSLPPAQPKLLPSTQQERRNENVLPEFTVTL